MENKKEFFEEENQKIKNILSEGSQSYFFKLENKNSLFSDLDRVDCTCMDEGCSYGKVRIGGSGILHDKGLDYVAEKMLQAGVTEVTSHDWCGAAGIWTKLNNKELEKSDDYGRDFALELVNKMKDLSGEDIKHRHMDKAEMLRPKELHTARSVYYDGVGGVNPISLTDMPSGFVVSRWAFDIDHSVANVKIAIEIALGGHGFGELFTNDNPFLVIVVANDETQLKELKNELKDLVVEYKDQVELVGFVK